MQQFKTGVKLMTLFALWNLLMTVVDLLMTLVALCSLLMRVVDLLMTLVAPLETTNNRECTSVNPFDFDTVSLISSEESKTVFDTTNLEEYIYQLITESAVVPLDSTMRTFVIQAILLSDFTLKVNLSACMCLHVCVCVCMHVCVCGHVHVHINADIIVLNFVYQAIGS